MTNQRQKLPRIQARFSGRTLSLCKSGRCFGSSMMNYRSDYGDRLEYFTKSVSISNAMAHSISCFNTITRRKGCGGIIYYPSATLCQLIMQLPFEHYHSIVLLKPAIHLQVPHVRYSSHSHLPRLRCHPGQQHKQQVSAVSSCHRH